MIVEPTRETGWTEGGTSGHPRRFISYPQCSRGRNIVWSYNQTSRPMKNGTYHLIVFALLFAIPVLVVQQQGLGLLSWLASLIPVGYLLAVLVSRVDRD